MRIARILAENLTVEERTLLLGLSSNQMPFAVDGMENLNSLRLIEKDHEAGTARVTPFGTNVIAAIREMKSA
ncbi:MAG: hypothetical protein AAF340_14955 [Pseudomonadota bacterium]